LIIDSHTHPYFADWYPGGKRGQMLDLPHDWRTIYERLHGGKLEIPTFDAFLEQIRRAGIDRVVVFDRDTETRDGRPPENDWVFDLAESYPDIFIPYYALDPNKGLAAIKALDKAVERGARGVKIIPYPAQLKPNDRRIYSLYDAIQALGVPVIFHTGPGPLGTRSDLSHARHFDDLCVDFPRLKIIMAHFGGDEFMTAHMLAWRYENLYVDFAFLPEVYLAAMPWDLFERTIPTKILLGSDFPLVMPEDRLATLRRLPLSEDTVRRISGENAAALLNL
jgi:predicted TIM-barrel fold metal-dependent hydrolase